MKSDEELVRATLDGERDAYALLVDRYNRAVFAVAYSVTRNHHSAQDATQDAFVAAYELLASLRNAGSFGAWIQKIARRKALRMQTIRARETAQEQTGGAARYQDSGRMDGNAEALLAAVLRLPDREQHTIMLHYFEGLSVADVAGIDGCPVGSVTKRLTRARERLRRYLSEG